MNLSEHVTATVDADGRVALPPEVATRLGLTPGIEVLIDEGPDGVRIRRPVEHLARVYIEPTSRCNLSCRTCIRNAWEEPPGDMSEEVFAQLLEGVAGLDPLPSVFFGGFGEPLAHPRIVEMVRSVKKLGVPSVELITNGCLLDRSVSRSLIEAGIDTLWVSLDGIRPESYGDVRLGALLPQVLDNLQGFKEVRREIQLPNLLPEERERYESRQHWLRNSWRLPEPVPVLGIVFVAMKRNIDDLSPLIAEAHKLGARLFLVTNVIPYTQELVDEVLYEDSLRASPLPTLWHDELRLPLMDVDDTTRKALRAALHGRHENSLVGKDVSGITRRCPFVEAGSVSISFRGDVSPCLALVHSHEEYVYGRKRRIERHVVGNLRDRSLGDIWMDPEYLAFRRRAQAFDFAPCLACGGCPMFEANEEDCEDNEFPRCGACLWSHGLVRCP